MMADDIRHNIRVYVAAQKTHLKEAISYRAQFLIYIGYFLILSASNLIGVTIIYGNSNGILGWSYYQMLILTATAALLFNLVLFTMDPGWFVNSMARGDMDIALSRPINSVVSLLSETGSKEILSAALGSLLVIGYALPHISSTPLQLFGFAVMFLFGLTAIISVWLFMVVLSYHLFKKGGFMYTLQGIFAISGQYPKALFGFGGGLLLTFVFPVALATTYPAETLFGAIGVYEYAAILLLCVAMAVLGYLGTKELLRHYCSGGG